MKIVSLAIGSVLAAFMIGCGQTAEGVKDDTRNNSINASATIQDGIDNGANMAKNAANDAKEAGEDLAVAAKLTPRIKNAINANPDLNATGNLIDVDTTSEQVSLSGHVNNQTLKDLASKIAKEEMAKAKAKQMFVNDLKIVSKPPQ